MDMTGEYRINAPRQKVWDALNDPAVLRACIPGCESLTREGDNRLAATLRVKIGPSLLLEADAPLLRNN